jgi:hypothetical protein
LSCSIRTMASAPFMGFVMTGFSVGGWLMAEQYSDENSGQYT